MRHFFASIFLSVVLLCVACTNDITEDIAVQSPQQLTVSFEENSRIQLCNGKTVWNEGDLVSVFYLSNGNEEWAFEGATGDRTGTLKKVRPAKGSKATSEVVVVYPYNPDYCLLSKILNVEAQLPAEQTYAENSYGIGSSIMIAASKEDNFSLKNTCGWLDLQLCNKSEFIVEKIVLKGGNNEQLAGDASLSTATLLRSLLPLKELFLRITIVLAVHSSLRTLSSESSHSFVQMA